MRALGYAALLALTAVPAFAESPDIYGSLRGVRWQLLSWSDQATTPRYPMDLSFGAGNAVSGQGACNYFEGASKIDADKIEVKISGWSKKMCEQDRMAEDMKFQANLERVRRFSLAADGILAATGGDGVVLMRFRRGSDKP